MRPRPARRPKADAPGYLERVNRVIDRLVSRPLEPLGLTAAARLAGLSPFHFHRVFQAVAGETLGDFARRLKLERALSRMAFGPRRTLTEVALESGFASSSDFSRAFRKKYGVAPRRFDLQAWRSTHRAELAPPRLAALPTPAGPAPEVTLRTLPARTVAYLRVRHPYRPAAVPEAAARLVAWAEARGLAGGQWLGYQYDNPELVPLEQCRYHVAVEAERFVAEGEVGRFRFPALTVAEVAVRGGIELELAALFHLYGQWLPRSGYVPDDAPAFEAWVGRPFAHGLERFELKVQLPVRRA